MRQIVEVPGLAHLPVLLGGSCRGIDQAVGEVSHDGRHLGIHLLADTQQHPLAPTVLNRIMEIRRSDLVRRAPSVSDQRGHGLQVPLGVRGVAAFALLARVHLLAQSTSHRNDRIL